MERAGRGEAKKAVTAGAIGNFVEWYDFSVYGFFAAAIGAQFFPSDDPVASLLATFAVFAVAFFMRPLGAFVFGHYGDRLGRRGALATAVIDRKSTRLNSSHANISYAVFCLKKK